MAADPTRTMHRVPYELAQSVPQTAGLISARLILDAGDDVADIAERLGLDPKQLAWGGDAALHAELDLPGGSWRVYPASRIALWISLRPGYDPPPTRRGARLLLARIVRRLRRRGMRFRDVRVHDGVSWSRSLGAADALGILKTSAPCGISAVWSCADRHPARVEIFDDGTLWASSPADAMWWAMEAVADD